MLRNRRSLPLVLALGAGVVVTSAFTLASRPCGSSCPLTASDPAPLSADQIAAEKATVLAAAGRAAMSYVAASQQGIDANDAGLAREHLEVARRILGQVQNAVGEGGERSPQVLPIFARIGISQAVEMTDELKVQLQALAPSVMKGEHHKVVEALKAAGVGAAYAYVDVPLAGTIAQVDAALDALEREEIEQARQAIIAASEGLVKNTLTVGTNDSTVREAIVAES